MKPLETINANRLVNAAQLEDSGLTLILLLLALETMHVHMPHLQTLVKGLATMRVKLEHVIEQKAPLGMTRAMAVHAKGYLEQLGISHAMDRGHVQEGRSDCRLAMTPAIAKIAVVV